MTGEAGADGQVGSLRLLDESRLADLLGVGQKDITRWRYNHQLPPHIKVGHRILWREELIVEWLLDKEMSGYQLYTPRGQGAIPPEDLPQLVAEYASGTVTLDDLAARYNVSREWIRLSVQAVDPNAARKARAERRLTRDSALQWEQTKVLLKRMQSAIDEDLHCVVCGAWVIRPPRNNGRKNATNFTCSQECAVAWPIIRTADLQEEHRKQQARSILNNPDGKAPTKIAWAKAMLSENPPPPNRSWVRKDSLRGAMLRKYRPERFTD